MYRKVGVMKLYPYHKVNSDNLKSLLFVARFIGMFGYVVMISSILLFIINLFGSDTTSVIDVGERSYTMTHEWEPQISEHIIMFAFGVIAAAIAGFLAAMVSIENSLKGKQE